MLGCPAIDDMLRRQDNDEHEVHPLGQLREPAGVFVQREGEVVMVANGSVLCAV